MSAAEVESILTAPEENIAAIRLGFESLHGSIDMVVESARWMIDNGMIEGL